MSLTVEKVTIKHSYIYLIIIICYFYRASGNGSAGPVLAGPVFLKVKLKIQFLQKASNKQKC